MICVRYVASVLAFALVTTVAAAGCRKSVPPQTVAAPPPPGVSGAVGDGQPTTTTTARATTPPAAAPTPPSVAAAPAPRPVSEEEAFSRKSLDQLNAERPLQDVFFDLDKSTIRDDARPLLQRNAEWMNRWRSTQVSVEGHCDSRGSSEYNLALGSRRAEAVKAYMVSLGIPSSRLTVVSKGKEQPFCHEETDACYSQNRRGHFVIAAK
jgi:peptidoglycan-associated lipoprotein